VLWEYGQVDGSDWAINDVTIAIERMRVMYVNAVWNSVFDPYMWIQTKRFPIPWQKCGNNFLWRRIFKHRHAIN